MWRDLLQQAVKDLKSVAAVSRAICGSDRLRPRLSLAINGKYFGDEKELERLILDRFARVRCPYLGEEITHAECRGHATQAAPTHNPAKLKQWRACQRCEVNAGQGETP